MLRLLILTCCLIPFISCTQDSGGHSSPPPIYYQYGHKVLPGIVDALPGDYKPERLSPKVFVKNGISYAPMDLQQQILTLNFDVSTSTVQGHALLKFYPTYENAYSLFQLSAPVSSATLNGQPVTLSTLTDPDGLNQTYYSVNQSLPMKEWATLELEYTLPSTRVTFINGGVRFLTDMTDLYTARFFENWGPANFEEDQFEMTLNLRVDQTSRVHTLYTNGAAENISSTEWKVTFPPYFTTSSFYVHLTERQMPVHSFQYQGFEKTIPVTVYSTSDSLVTEAAQILPDLLAEMERDFGPYPHPRFIAYLHSGGGGMEYSGATITGLSALDHELFHSWFARGVMPAEGRSGWIDEAFASWRDNGYFQASSLLERAPTQLAGFSPYRKSTPENCYRDGRRLIAELDRHYLEFGGMKPLMKLFFQRYKHQVVTTEEFWMFLNHVTQSRADDFFNRYAFNLGPTFQTELDLDSETSLHPQKLRQDEILNLR